MITIPLIANLLNAFTSLYNTVYFTTMRMSCIMGTIVVGATFCMILVPVFVTLLGIYDACVDFAVSNSLVFVMCASYR